MITITIQYNKINLQKATLQGLEFLLECLLHQEWFEKCAEVRDEINNRKLININS